jgi:ubiquinone/menaquinone biosynthesis C-methylase UbiE
MALAADESPERLDADEQHGRLIVSEHRGRYLWGAQLASGLKVLDAGCGTGYGLRILKEAGAAQTVGVDVSADAVAQASEAMSDEHIEVLQADLKELPFSDGEFDLIVCFEVIEHVPEREVILDELARVLAADGVLCISTPNRNVYPQGNPYHLHEYEPDEFAQALGKRFSHVDLHRQTAWLASAIFSSDEFAADRSDGSIPTRTVKMESRDPGEETFTVALAARRSIPGVESLLTLGEPFEVRWWQERIDDGRKSAEALAASAEALAARTRQQAASAEARSLNSAKRLLEVEEVLAQANARVFALEQELETRGKELHEQVARAERVMIGMKESVSWRITAPLRALKRRG